MTKQKLDHLAEQIRKAHSGIDAHQHLLDTIADAIEAEFTGGTLSIFKVSEFVRRFQP